MIVYATVPSSITPNEIRSAANIHYLTIKSQKRHREFKYWILEIEIKKKQYCQLVLFGIHIGRYIK